MDAEQTKAAGEAANHWHWLGAAIGGVAGFFGVSKIARRKQVEDVPLADVIRTEMAALRAENQKTREELGALLERIHIRLDVLADRRS